jgi:Apea-like HEPN
MSKQSNEAEKLARMDKRFEEMEVYLTRFEAAFDELHLAVTNQIKIHGQNIGPHHDYPKMSMLDSGFPAFREAGFFDPNSQRDYISTVQVRGLAGLLANHKRPKISLPKCTELADFLRKHDIGKRLKLEEHIYEGKVFDWPVEQMIGDAVERYLHLFGVDSPIELKHRNAVIWPLILGTIKSKLDLRLVIPITLTHFDVDHFSLTETSYIARIPKRLNLARAQMSTFGTGAVSTVVGAATHAFVSNEWHLEDVYPKDVARSLNKSSPNVDDAADSFFGALRVATGVDAGYAQILWVPRRWALNYFCDLTPVYGTTVRQYPDSYDNYGWTRRGPLVTKKNLEEVRRIYRAIVSNNDEGLRLALRRLNACHTRSDAADAILDGTIGLELLLGDSENQSLSYKLRLRAAALAMLQCDPAKPPAEIYAKVNRLYNARSSIVHGKKIKRTKTASEPSTNKYAEDRAIASDLLRFVLDVLLTHPKYLDPTKIDNGLLLQSDMKTIDKPGESLELTPEDKKMPGV